MRSSLFNRSILLFAILSHLWIVDSLQAAGAESQSAFWVWHRKDPLGPQERLALREMKASLLWYTGELTLNADEKEAAPQWRFKEPNPEGRATPVLRLHLQGKAPFYGEAGGRLLQTTLEAVDPEGRLQLDYESPVGQLGNYATFLKKVRKKAPQLTLVALSEWVNKRGWKSLQWSVSGMDVLFYNRHADPAVITGNDQPKPLLKQEDLARQLRQWRTSKVKWRAGLPNFSRLTLFDADGGSKGEIRNWTWDEVIFQPRLKYAGSPSPGLVLLKSDEDLVLANTPIFAGSTVVVRWVERGALVEALKLVKKSHAKGPVFFQLPDSTDAGGWSLPQLQELIEGRVEPPTLALRYEIDRFVLENRGRSDVAPRINGDAPEDRAFYVEIDAPARAWQEALPGDFWRLGAHMLLPEGPVAVAVPLSSRLTFWFSHLPSGDFLKSGLVQFAPGTDLSKVRYRILPESREWRPIEIAKPQTSGSPQ